MELGLIEPDIGVELLPERVVPTHRPSRLGHIVLIGNHLPRRCGIATYTSDVATALRTRYPDLRIDVWAMNDGRVYDYPPTVTGTIDQDDPESYRAAARSIAASGADMLWVQHEFGIFGGAAGSHVLRLIDRMAIPVAATLHTVLARPDRAHREVIQALVDRCETLIVMAAEARRILIENHDADPDRIVVIPHGVPNRPFSETAHYKSRLGFGGRDVIMTFGLLSPGKGIETIIEAMPDVVARRPDALYLVLGATHPNCIAWQGETYRDSLMQKASELGVSEHVRLIDGFFDTEAILDYLAAADVYVTPYLNPEQVTSGTLAYAAGLGKPIVSTPYVHARELLANGLGRLVAFRDAPGFADAIVGLLDDPRGTKRLRERLYAVGRTMIWPRLAEASMERFEKVVEQLRNAPVRLMSPELPKRIGDSAIARMTDATGIYQHSVFGVPDRHHGYCIDDNARALMLACRSAGAARARSATYAAFVAHAWNRDHRRFRNFMGFDRQWLESEGSEDSCGRALWALGVTTREAPDAELQLWAGKLFEEATEPLSWLRSPRAQAFVMLGLVAHGDADRSMLTRLADGLASLHREYRAPEWQWFEPVLAYDNARICEALIRAGTVLGRRELIALGIDTLDWLCALQQTPDGHFDAIGTDSFGRHYAPPLPFDQQPVEAWSMIDACAAAMAATGEARWGAAAVNAYRWFLGKNRLGLALGDIDSGECFDGLTPTGVNRNRGAESILAFQHATLSIQPFRRDGC